MHLLKTEKPVFYSNVLVLQVGSKTSDADMWPLSNCIISRSSKLPYGPSNKRQ